MHTVSYNLPVDLYTTSKQKKANSLVTITHVMIIYLMHLHSDFLLNIPAT